jgi:hypothetical protein
MEVDREEVAAMILSNSRVELQIARARASLLATHAHIADGVVARLGSRLPTVRLIELYCQALALSEFEGAWLQIHAVAHAGTGRHADCEPGTGVALGRTWHSLVDRLRSTLAPYGDAELQELLAFEFAAARVTVMKVHVRTAVSFARALRADMNAPAAVALYLHRLDVSEDLRGAVHAFALAHLSPEHAAAMLPPGEMLEAGMLTPASG